MTRFRKAVLATTLLVCGGPGCAVATPSSTGESPRSAPAAECRNASGATGRGTDVLVEGERRATVRIDDRSPCQRTYRLSTTAPLRDGMPANPRVFRERPGMPRVRTNHDMFDALYALALDEVREASVESIRDDAFDRGQPRRCPEGGCFETGRLWTYVWTRDTSFAAHLGLAALDPRRAANSLGYKLSERRTGGDLQIVQDTGSGGSYPISTDRVVWALGARAALDHLDGAARVAFATRALDAVRNTVEHDRRVVFDPSDGLYTGETSFLDWREQTYPPWTRADTVHIGMSKALSTNVAHVAILDLAGELSSDRGDAPLAQRYASWAEKLREAIRRRFWIEPRHMFGAFTSTLLDPAPVSRHDLLGTSLAVLLEVATPAQARDAIANYPHAGMGPPVVWPQQQATPVYHNRAYWPFVTAYLLKAARQVDNAAVVDRNVASMMTGAAHNLSNMENFELVSGLARVDDGGSPGPVINSQRQLWSVAGYVSMVHDVVFGVETSAAGIRFEPYLTRRLRNTIFSGSDELVLDEFPYRGRKITVVVNLPARGGPHSGAYRVAGRRLDGRPIDGRVLAAANLAPRSTLEIDLAERTSAPAPIRVIERPEGPSLFGPKTPRIVALAAEGKRLRVDWELDDPAAGDVAFDVYKDGALVAHALLPSTKRWVDPSADAASERSPCYSVEAYYRSSGNPSQRAAPRCWYGPGDERVRTILARELRARGDGISRSGGREHHARWSEIELPSFRASRSGEHLVQLVAANGGPVNTGVTCGVTHATVEELPAGRVVADGPIFVPHLGSWDTWGDSSVLRVALEAGRAYRIRLHASAVAINMSAFRHFEHYTQGAGGAAGAQNSIHVAAIRILPYDPR